MCHDALVCLDIKSFFLFPELNGNFSYISSKPVKTILQEKLKRIHKFKKETYHLLFMTLVKTEICSKDLRPCAEDAEHF